MIHVVAYRFSALGDLCLCYPVLKKVLELNPDLEITFVTRSQFAGFFTEIPRLRVLKADFKSEHQGVLGLWRLAKTLRSLGPIHKTCDLHGVLRSRLLGLMLPGPKVTIDKGRQDRQRYLTRKSQHPLMHVTERYLEVFGKVGLKVPQSVEDLKNIRFETSSKLSPKALAFLQLAPHSQRLAIAPFAKHFTKTWPLEKWTHFLDLINDRSLPIHVFLMGGPGEEAQKLQALAEKYEFVTNVAGQLNMQEEVLFLREMNLSLAMDSANMHFAALAGSPLLSIWGGTHTDMGFSPVTTRHQTLEIPKVDLPCRPCSVFGRGQCPLGHFQCMEDITPQALMDQVSSLLKIVN